LFSLAIVSAPNNESILTNYTCLHNLNYTPEIRKGIEKLSDLSKRQTIIQWLEIELLEKFHSRIINIDPAVADKWGYLCSINNIPAIDALIAASAIVHNLKLVTRNIKDFSSIAGLEIINPWE
jgi:predicted nucleic acid-binding protein